MRPKEVICKWVKFLHFDIMQYTNPTIRKCTLIPLLIRILLKYVHILRPTAWGPTQPNLVQIYKFMRLREVICKWERLLHFYIMEYSKPTIQNCKLILLLVRI